MCRPAGPGAFPTRRRGCGEGPCAQFQIPTTSYCIAPDHEPEEWNSPSRSSEVRSRQRAKRLALWRSSGGRAPVVTQPEALRAVGSLELEPLGAGLTIHDL